MKKLSLFFILLSIFVCITTFAQSAEPAKTMNLSLSTYYPSPHGQYERLRLVPRSNITGTCQIGTFYVSAPDDMFFCEDPDEDNVGEWGPFPGGLWTHKEVSTDHLLYFTANDDYLVPDKTSLKVGIGTKTPEATLHIAGDGTLLLEDTGYGMFFSDTNGAASNRNDFRFRGTEGNAFYIDSGIYPDDDWDNLMVLHRDGNLGLGMNEIGGVSEMPLFKLSLDNDGGIFARGKLTQGTFMPADLIAPGESIDAFIWYPRKSALRVGRVDHFFAASDFGEEWDNSNIGLSSISFGYNNMAKGIRSVVSGGAYNDATGYASTIGGGGANIASGFRSVISGGKENVASATHVTISGGESNTANGVYSTIPGGKNNVADGDHSLASGKYMQLDEFADRTFVWGYSNTPVNISTPDAFIIYSGNVGVGTTTPAEKLEVNGNVKLTTDGAGNPQHRITDVAAPVDGNDVTTKDWVLAQAGGGNFIVTTRLKAAATCDPVIYPPPTEFCPTDWSAVENWLDCYADGWSRQTLCKKN